MSDLKIINSKRKRSKHKKYRIISSRSNTHTADTHINYSIVCQSIILNKKKPLSTLLIKTTKNNKILKQIKFMSITLTGKLTGKYAIEINKP